MPQVFVLWRTERTALWRMELLLCEVKWFAFITEPEGWDSSIETQWKTEVSFQREEFKERKRRRSPSSILSQTWTLGMRHCSWAQTGPGRDKQKYFKILQVHFRSLIPFLQPMFSEPLRCARHCSGPLGCTSDQNRQRSCSYGDVLPEERDRQ